MTPTPELFHWFPEGLPDDLLALDDMALLAELGGPTLIRVPGTEQARPRAISALLHGDESTGFTATMRILRRKRQYPFDLYVLFGNIRAALAGDGFSERFLEGQEDFNRVWGLHEPTTKMRIAADQILAILHDADIASLADIHNNSGDNPFYAIVTNMRNETINLATMFTTTLLYWDLEAHTLMECFEGDVAAIAVECGLPGLPESEAFALDALRRYLGASEIRSGEVARDFDLLDDIKKVSVRPEVRFAFGGSISDDIDFAVAEDADVHNFVEVPAGHELGTVYPGSLPPVLAIDAKGEDVTDQYFQVVDGTLRLTRRATPVMMTRTVEAARKDCLFYLATQQPPRR